MADLPVGCGQEWTLRSSLTMPDEEEDLDELDDEEEELDNEEEVPEKLPFGWEDLIFGALAIFLIVGVWRSCG